MAWSDAARAAAAEARRNHAPERIAAAHAARYVRKEMKNYAAKNTYARKYIHAALNGYTIYSPLPGRSHNRALRQARISHKFGK